MNILKLANNALFKYLLCPRSPELARAIHEVTESTINPETIAISVLLYD
jgi:hypothetical protein